MWLRFLAVLGAVAILATSACTQESGSESPTSTAAAAPQAETSNPSTTVKVENPQSGIVTVVGIVTSIGTSEHGGDSWTYKLGSGETLELASSLLQGCSYWGTPPMSFGEVHPECAIVALVESGGTATLAKDLHIPTGEDADLWQEIIGDRLIGLLTISDLTGDRTQVITDEGFALAVDSEAIWVCDPTTFDPPVGVVLVIDLDTSRVLRVECLGEA